MSTPLQKEATALWLIKNTKLTFKQMVALVQESGGQQAIDPTDKELFAWAQRVAQTKFQESMKAEVYAGLVYERMGGVFEMYDVLSEDQK
jgi:iron only hydrogenase large subunit-like protein